MSEPDAAALSASEPPCDHERVVHVTGVCCACGEVSEQYLDWYAKFGSDEQGERDV